MRWCGGGGGGGRKKGPGSRTRAGEGEADSRSEPSGAPTRAHARYISWVGGISQEHSDALTR